MERQVESLQEELLSTQNALQVSSEVRFFLGGGGACNSLFSLRVNIYCFVVVVIVVSFVPEYW